MSIARYPLAWPAGWPRAKTRRTAAFKVDYDKALRELGWEIERLGGRYPIMSTNMELRLDGQPRRDKGEPRDPGVAVYFELKGTQKVFACDTFSRVKDNIRAISLTIAALRAIERFGATDMLERALTAFTALPAPKSCWEILGLQPGASAGMIQAAGRKLAKQHHPDRGGTDARMAEINAARDEALKGAAA
jgi:DnaJ-like protein